MKMCLVAGTVFQLHHRLPRSLSSFPDATEFFSLPALQCAKDSVFGHFLLGCPSKFSCRLWVLKHVSTSVPVGRGGLGGVAQTSVFFVFG